MATYLCVKVNNTTKKFTAKESKEAGKPYLRVPGGYFPLTTETTTGTQLKVRANNTNYRIVETYTTTRQGQTTSQSTSSDFLSTYSVGQQQYSSSPLITFKNSIHGATFSLTMTCTYQIIDYPDERGTITVRRRVTVTAPNGTHSFIGHTYKHDIEGGIFDKYKSGHLLSWLRNSSNNYRYASELAVYNNINNYMFEVVKTGLDVGLFSDGANGNTSMTYIGGSQARITFPHVNVYAYHSQNISVYSRYFKLDSEYDFRDITSSYLYNGWRADIATTYSYTYSTIPIFNMGGTNVYGGANMNPTNTARIVNERVQLDETWSAPGTHTLKTRLITNHSDLSSMYVSTDTITYNTTYQSTYTTQ